MKSHRLTGLGVWWLRNPLSRSYSVRVLRALGAEVGEGVTIKRSILLDNVWEDENSTGDLSHLHLADRAYIGDGVYFDLASDVWIGEGAGIGAGTHFVTHFDPNRAPFLSAHMERLCAPVRVERGAIVGVQVTLLAGSVVGEDSLLGAQSLLPQGATVTPRTIWGGVPARELGAITP